MTYFCELFNLSEYVHTYAPTGQFKCCCDSAGNDTKAFMRRNEIDGKVRATNAWDVFRFLDSKMYV